MQTDWNKFVMAVSTTTIARLFANVAERCATHAFLAVLPQTATAYGIEAGEITYGDTQKTISELIEQYRIAGYGHGHRVGILVENRPCFFFHWFALNALGASVVPINPDLRAAELEYLVNHSEIRAALVLPARRDSIATAGREVAVFAPDEPPPPALCRPPESGAPGPQSEAALLYTSGTTGRPKGCVLSNEYFLCTAGWYMASDDLITLRPGSERMLTPLPLFHMNAMAYSTMAMLSSGGCLTVLDRFHPRTWWESVRECRATIVHYLGVMPPLLLAAEATDEDRRHSVRFGFGAGVDRSLHARFEQRFGFPLIEAWAMTETGAGAVIVASSEPRHVGTSCFGKPKPPLEIRIMLEGGEVAPVDTPGELLVRRDRTNPQFGFFSGYLKDAEATEAAWEGGWFHTGDVVRQGADGSLYFVDRRKNIIRRSGENISAVEVESVLLQYCGISQVAVAPVPDPVRGDEVLACIVTDITPADRARFAADLVTWCLTRLAYYKAPGFVAFVDRVPLTTTQKIQRGELKSLAASLPGDARCIDTTALKKRPAA
jgi:acyl-CoA synthetase (AMP-forming)/AMP-acid ligase II